MAKLIVSTIGMTLFSPFDLTSEERRIIKSHANDTHFAPATRKVVNRLRQKMLVHPEYLFRAVEFKTLTIYAQKTAQLQHWAMPNVRYVFIASQTPFGQFMREMCDRVIRRSYPQLRCEFISVAGLQVANAAGLDDAMRELTAFLDKLCESYQRYDVIFNISGGFKFISGSMQSYANYHGYPTVYSFDGEQMIMTKPEVPGQFPPRLVYI